MSDMPESATFSGTLPDAEMFDLSDWPTVFIHFPELGVPNRTQRLLGGLDRLLEQKQRFVAVWIQARHGHEREPHEDERQGAIWVKRNKVALIDYCIGYLYLTTDPDVKESLLAMFPKVKSLLPFPKVIVDSEDEALEAASKLFHSCG